MPYYNLEQLKQANHIDDVARELLSKPKGKSRSKYFCCPNGEEHTHGVDQDGHLEVYPDGRCYCHRCEWGGSVIDLVAKARNVSIGEACEWLAWRGRVEPLVHQGRGMVEKSKARHKDTDFTRVPRVLTRYGMLRELSPVAAKVYLALACHAHPYTRTTTVGGQELATETGYKRKTVYNCTSELKRKGLIRVYYHRTGKGFRRTIQILASDQIIPHFPEVKKDA